MQSIGQTPLVMQREVDGFIMNRLQAAVLQEAFRMVANGVASVEDVDAGIKMGIGLRWAFIGPFETINLNAPGGVADYASRYGEGMYQIAETLTPPMRWDGALLERVAQELDKRVPPHKRRERQIWRDKRLIALMAHLAQAEADLGARRAPSGRRRQSKSDRGRGREHVRAAASDCDRSVRRSSRVTASTHVDRLDRDQSRRRRDDELSRRTVLRSRRQSLCRRRSARSYFPHLAIRQVRRRRRI